MVAIDPGRTALIPIDFVNDLVHPDGVFGSTGLADRLRKARTLELAARVMSAARRRGIPVVHVRLAWRPGHVDLSPHLPLVAPGKANDAIVEGTWGAELHPAVDAVDGEVVVNKAGISAFGGTDLHRILTLGRISTLVLGGFATNWAVESTARDAVDLGYRVLVLEDCCLGYDEGTHRFAVEHILPMLGTVTTSSALLAALELDAVAFTRTVSGPVPA